MSKKNTDVIPNKQTEIKIYMRNQFLLHNVIDESGKILNLNKFVELVQKEIKKCQKEMADNETENGVVKDQMLQSVLIGELEYLQSLAKHTKNIDPLIENPIKSYEDLPKKPKKIWFPNLRITKIIIQDRIGSWLQH